MEGWRAALARLLGEPEGDEGPLALVSPDQVALLLASIELKHEALIAENERLRRENGALAARIAELEGTPLPPPLPRPPSAPPGGLRRA